MKKKYIFTFWVLLCFTIPLSARVWYVKTDGDNAKDGTSWANAKNGSWLYSLAGVRNEDVILIGAGDYSGVANIPVPKNTSLSFVGGLDTSGAGGCGVTQFLTTNTSDPTIIFNIDGGMGNLYVSGITFRRQAVIDNVTIAKWSGQTSGTYNFTNIKIIGKNNTAFDMSPGGNQNITINFTNVSATGNSNTPFNLSGANNRNFTVNFDKFYAFDNQDSVIYATGSGDRNDVAPGTLNITSSVFCSNGTYSGTNYGGAVNAGQYLYLNSSNNFYLNNRVRWTGGAISVGWAPDGSDNGPVRFSSTRDYFQGNHAHKGGGLFYYQNEKFQAPVIDGKPNFSVKESKFYDNWATGNVLSALQYTEGGAIALMGSYTNDMPIITDSEFSKDASGNDGGAIAVGTQTGGYGVQAPALYSLNNRFYDCYGGNINGWGGAISYYASSTSAAAPSSPYNGYHLIIENNRFFRNYAESQMELSRGGAIGTQKNNPYLNLYILNSLFKANHAKNDGGAIYLAGGNKVRIENSKFEDNKLSIGLNQDGSAIYAKDISVEIVGSRFRRNIRNANDNYIEFVSSSAPYTVSSTQLQQSDAAYNRSWLTKTAVTYDGNLLPADIIPDEQSTISPLDSACPADTNNDTCGVCYISPSTNSPLPVKHGITLLHRAGSDNGGWPMNRNSAHTVLESNTKGFVITRMTSDPEAVAAPNFLSNDPAKSRIKQPTEGMMVYDTYAKCLKIYSDGAWSCFSVPTCQ